MEVLFRKQHDVCREIHRQLLIRCKNDVDHEKDWDKKCYFIRSFARIIRILTCTNSAFYNYYSNTKTAQQIINVFMKLCRLEYCELINYFKLKDNIFDLIDKKINHLFDIAFDSDKHFTEEDLQDAWFLNKKLLMNDEVVKERLSSYNNKLIIKCIDSITFRRQSLLTIAFKNKDLIKIEQLLKAGAKGDVYESDILKEIAKERCIDKNYDLEIAKLLLHYGINPNLRYFDDDTSALMIAVYNDDQQYTTLLLKYKADPYQRIKRDNSSLEFPFFYSKTSKARNIFDIIGTEKQWFLDLIHH